MLRKIFSVFFLWVPFGFWFLFILFDRWIVKIHEIFYIAAVIIPFASLLLFLYIGLLYIIYRSKKYKILFILVISISSFKYMDHWISFGTEPAQNEIQLNVVTWNVERLGALKDEDYKENIKTVSNFLSNTNADIAIIQEISLKQVKRLSEEMGLNGKDYMWSSYYVGSWGGLAVLVINNNDWKIRSKKTTPLPPNWQYVFTEVSHKTGININVLGVHLAPPKLTDRGILQSSKKFIAGNPSQLKKLLKSYVKAAKLQNSQAAQLNDVIQLFNDPTIVAGDFNSPAQLPVHNTFRNHLNDSWLYGGSGLGATRYWGNILPFRIDYIYTSEHFNINKTSTHEQLFSDHKPVSTSLFLSK
jgi:endonuclease/exonuclease/phosphatase family metal-dependent hydrolase